MQRLKQPKKSNTFEFGDKVKINSMFFRNHGQRIIDIEGIVKEIVPTWESPLPAVKIMITFNPVVLQFSQSGYLKYTTIKENDGFKMLVRIHPMYLDKVK